MGLWHRVIQHYLHVMFWKTMLQHDANPRKRDGPLLILLSFPSQPLLLLLLLLPKPFSYSLLGLLML